MTTSEIEKLAWRQAKGEEICARVTRSADAALVRADGAGRSPFTASLLLSASMLSTTAFAQDRAKPAVPATAILTGRLLAPNGKPFADPNAYASLIPDVGQEYGAKLDSNGRFEIHAAPGTYNLLVRSNPIFGARIKGATLHEGIQDVGDLRAAVLTGSDGYETVTVGAMMANISYGPRFWLRHPVRYVQHLGWKVRRAFTN